MKKNEMLSQASVISEKLEGQIRLLDASKVFGLDHLKSAFQKASRAFEENENLSDSVVTETMLYMSGGRQIQDAVKIIGIQENTKFIVVITDIDGSHRNEIVKSLSLKEDDSIITDIQAKD
ncbi:MAG: KEOPS complex subunit Cgi121, partial [Thermoplasmata archaeon]|nr:KEOPS complex subunit Cgi121 [Thermoplasmata archaeon]